jgi:hypothetical protein
MIGHFPSFIASRSFIVRRLLKIKFGHSRSKTRQLRGLPTVPYPDQSGPLIRRPSFDNRPLARAGSPANRDRCCREQDGDICRLAP